MSELKILNEMNEMCIESLPPNLYEQWEQIQKELRKTRKELKK